MSGGLGGIGLVVLGAVAVTTTVTNVDCATVVVDPLTVLLEVFTTPRLHTALLLVLLQLPVPPTVTELIVEFVPCTVSVKTTPFTGSLVL